MVTNNSTNKTSNRYILLEVVVPQGLNRIPELCNAITQFAKETSGYGVEGVLVSSQEAQPLFEECLNARANGGLKPGEMYIKLQMRDNLSHLLNTTQGHTRFKDLDQAFTNMGKLNGMFDSEGNPRFAMITRKDPLDMERDVDYRYYIKSAVMQKEPCLNDDGSIQTTSIGGTEVPLHLYAITFNPYKAGNTPDLEDLCGGNAKDSPESKRLVEWVKAYFCNFGGWGIPCGGLDSDGLHTWCNPSTFLLGVHERNTVMIMAPHIDHYGMVVEEALSIKEHWANERAKTERPQGGVNMSAYKNVPFM